MQALLPMAAPPLSVQAADWPMAACVLAGGVASVPKPNRTLLGSCVVLPSVVH